MMRSDADVLERWQAGTTICTERRLNDLSAAADDLTTLAQTREGAHMIRGNFHQLKAVLQKLHDLAIEFKGVAK